MRKNNITLLLLAAYLTVVTTATDHLRHRKLGDDCYDFDLNRCRRESSCEIAETRSGRERCVEKDDCEYFKHYDCPENDGCKVVKINGNKRCVDDDYYELCRSSSSEEDCWEHHKDCSWDGSSGCRSNHDIDDRDLCRVGRSECNDDEICVALDWIVLDMTFCLDDILGHCVSEPRKQDCPSSKDEVCGCDGFTYDNACKCFAAGNNVKYEGPCSSALDRDFRRNIRNLDEYQDHTNELLRQFVYSSTSTDGDICLTELECEQQSRFDSARFDTVQDPNNCGCFEWRGRYYFSDHNKCSQKKMKTLSLQNTRERVHCDLERLYRNVRNYPYDTCLTADECEDQCELDNLAPMKIRNSDSEKGCYRRKGNRKCYWSGGGSNVQKSSSLSGDFKRVECTDTSRDVRNVVGDTCLTRGECETQGLIDGDVKLPSFAKYDTHCGCYKKGGSLYWGYCDFGDFSTQLGGQKERVKCRDVNKSYRVFERDGTAGHTHYHTHNDYDHDHYHYDDEYYYYM